ncbi:MAG: AsmA-like C-terminal region-containing protein [Bacteroidota bacterium]
MKFPKVSFKIKNPKLARRLKRTAVTLLITLVSLFGTGLFVGYYYEDTIKKIIIDQLNKRLATEIQVKEIEFSIFKKFPFASVHFIDAVAKDAWSDPKIKKETLLEAKDVWLEFSILDLIFKEFTIKRIEVDHAKLALKILKDGTDNFQFLKPSSDTTDKSFQFDLTKLILNEVAVSYLDQKNSQDYRVLAHKLMLKGHFSEKDYTLNIEGRLFVNRIRSHRINYFSNKETSVDVTLYVNSNMGRYTFKEGGLAFGNMKLDVTGDIISNKTADSLNLKIEGKNLELRTLIEELPSQYGEYFKEYNCKGKCYFTASIIGSVKGQDRPQVSVLFGVENGDFSQKASNMRLAGVKFNASYSNGSKRDASTSVLKFSDFSASLKEGSVSGSFAMTNFNHPEVQLKAVANLNLADIQEFLKIDTVNSASGKLTLDVDFNGVMNSSSFTMADFVSSKTAGKLTLENCTIEFKGSKHSFSNLNGTFDFTNNDLGTENFTGNFSQSDFAIKGYFRNLLPFLVLQKEHLQINASLTSSNLDMDNLLQYRMSEMDTVYKLSLAEQLDFKLDLNIRKFNFRKFNASNISGTVIMKDRQFVAQNLSLNAMDGRISASGLVDASQPEKLLISCDANIKRVNISKLFYQFGNFGMTSFKDENINGTLTADIQFASVWSNTFEVDKNTIYAHAGIKIENGELIGYAPVMGLTKFLKGRDLTHIKFATLTNQIEIKDKVISIPAMEIQSDVIDFSAYGTHTFDNHIDYHLSMLIADLKNPSKNNKDDGSEYGQIIDDGLHKEKYFFRITGTVEKPEYIAIDKDAYKQNIADKVQQEKQNLKSILNKEFGWFKKDADSTGNKKKDKYDFNIQFDDEEKSADSTGLPKKETGKGIEKQKPKKQTRKKVIVTGGID